MRDADIHAVLRHVKTVGSQWPEPVVGIIARETRDPFAILISCLLSLRTKDHTTREACRRLFALASQPRPLSKLGLPRIEKAIYPVGFYRRKARQIRAICQELVVAYGEKVPDSIEELLKFPGVGRKTANLVVTVGYGKPGICVDIHVHRICNRWGYVQTRSPDETEKVLRRKLPRRYWATLNDLLVPFGQHCCRPVSPYCSQCRVIAYCARRGVGTSR